MNLQTTVPLSSIYTREEDFSDDLADNLDALRVGSFEDPETESNVGTRRADSVRLNFAGENKVKRRDEVMQLFPKSDYNYEYRISPKEAKVQFPVLDKGKNDRDDWDEIREKLVAMGTDIYNRINESDL